MKIPTPEEAWNLLREYNNIIKETFIKNMGGGDVLRWQAIKPACLLILSFKEKTERPIRERSAFSLAFHHFIALSTSSGLSELPIIGAALSSARRAAISSIVSSKSNILIFS